MACFFSTNGEGLDDRAERFLFVEFDEEEDSTGNKLDVVPRRLDMDDSWEFCKVSLLRFPLVVAAIFCWDDENDLVEISLFEPVSRKRPIACTKAAHAGAKKKGKEIKKF